MRPHRLELTAFGAFPGAVELDLDQLGTGGLVLLCGETGGGKTTLLDALGFALYGAVPGLRGVRDLRSHHAAADAAPRVRLEYSVPAGRFRVTRSPGWDRPKRRGTGTQREHPKASLEKWTGSAWRTEATRNDDVGLEISVHLGMKPEQFFQVVMLPQGRFADFLHADNDAREALLKQLFSVGLFERVEQWLADRAKRAADDYGLARQSLDRVQAKIIEAAGVEARPDDERQDDGQQDDGQRDDAAPGGTDGPPGPDWAASLAEAARAGQISAATRRDEAAKARELADRQLAATREAARRAEDRARLRARLAELVELAPEITSLATELDAAGRASTVSRAVADAAGRADEASRAARDEAAARAALDAATVPSLDAAREPSGQLRAGPDADAGGLGRLAALAHTESGRLEALALALTTADEAEREVMAADRDALTHAQAAEIHVTEIETTFPIARGTAQDRVGRARQAARLAPALAERAGQLADLADAVRARHAALLTADEAQAAATRARARAAELRQQRFDAITAELAAALTGDTPCPVCGSLAHPDPAEVRADHVNKDDERAADEEAG
ncbi:AAA family ATPase, partial [Pseudofrankia sp. BMG5.36]